MNDIEEIKKNIKGVAKSLIGFMESGHLGDNISHLRTNASILLLNADKLSEIRNRNPFIDNETIVCAKCGDKHSLKNDTINLLASGNGLLYPCGCGNIVDLKVSDYKIFK